MKYLVILFAIVAIVAAFPEPEQERERRGILGGAALGTTILAGPKIAAAPLLVSAPKVLAAPAAVIASPWAGAGWGAKAW